MSTKNELLEIIETDQWIKIKKLDQNIIGSFLRCGEGDLAYEMLLEHHEKETEFLINKCRELAKQLNIAIIQRDSFAEQVKGLEEEMDYE